MKKTPSTSSVCRRALLTCASTAMALLAWPSTALAQAGAWPSKPIRVVVNFPPGSSPDVLARAVSQPLQQALGQPVIIENRAGASGMIGAEVVAKSPADGHTLLMTAGSAITTNPFIYASMPYDSDKDLVPVAAAARITLFLVARADLPVKNAQEFLAYLKANPGKLSYASAGNATGLHLAGEMLKSQAGVYALHVPYRGSTPALQDLLAGQVDFLFDPGISLAHVRSGKLRLLAVAGMRRSPAFPDVPTLNEVGLKGFDAGQTHGFYAPAGTPATVVERLNSEINRILVMPSVKAQMDTLAAEATPLTVAQFAAVMAEDSKRYGAIIKERKIKAD
ncbi:MAG: tripartite tricarboxylate transporter substrate binding protein [Hydrogenophaga sp.]|jgi:tripartite-type tricarboxylate transporter receptor subunit TctC|uniref:Bug family tripartite tricarboxylate transporter substrate binding protein n=1 Tax=Hydrogenophaga sp. TaxID=1904254 RepID=UPI001DC14815|nr:tripartite tricarboxylate transporter substrate binding protein [Hydrogenophaga sp.]MBW0171979.1 tripartite tricarboxylate transporter substrate binding protein [Hydrogenophaga sp.]MBW0185179.1 tripartite tricarboxylate transporter substrate binding protein [Hydrogenophaga sp.]